MTKIFSYSVSKPSFKRKIDFSVLPQTLVGPRRFPPLPPPHPPLSPHFPPQRRPRREGGPPGHTGLRRGTHLKYCSSASLHHKMTPEVSMTV